MRKPISQREAQKLRKRVDQLEAREDARLSRWATDWPGGTHIGTINLGQANLTGRIEVARMLGHAVVLTTQSDGKLEVYALPLRKQPTT